MELNNLVQLVSKNYEIDKQYYTQYNVKRGLRNNDGSGVLVGLTKIGDVHGYIKDEEELVPVEGVLRYRGIKIDQIVENVQNEKRLGFEETAFLLLFGQLPTAEQLDFFNTLLDKHRRLPEGFTENMILKSPSNNIMNKLSRSTLAIYSYDDNPEDLSVGNVLRQSIELISQFPTMVAYGYQAKSHYYNNKSLFLHQPVIGIGTAKNFLHMIRPDSKYTELEAMTLDICLLIHAEHGGGNNSSFTSHVVSSSDTDTYSAISAAVGSLKGLKHGGANIKVINMMKEIKLKVKDWSNEKEVADYLAKILNKQAFDKTGLIYGIGHAIYTLSDPRATILKKYAMEMARATGKEDEYKLYHLIERLAPEVFKDVKKSNKTICANVDFYSGFVYEMMGIPHELYTPLFAMARIVGWCSHRLEEMICGGRIIRPAYKSVGKKDDYLKLLDR